MKFLVEALDGTYTDREALPAGLLAWVNLSLLMKAFVIAFLKCLCLDSCFITQASIALSPWRKEDKVFLGPTNRKDLVFMKRCAFPCTL